MGRRVLGLRLPRPRVPPGRLTMRRGWTLVETILLLLVGAVAAAVFLPKWIEARKSDLEMSAIRVMWQIREAEETLKSNDLDGNRRLDYWVRDVRGLARFRAAGATAGLIDDRTAMADAAYANAQPLHSHLFYMHQRDCLSGMAVAADGTAEEFVVYTRGFPLGSYRNIWAWDSERGHTKRGPEESQPWRDLPESPAAAGYATVCW